MIWRTVRQGWSASGRKGLPMHVRPRRLMAALSIVLLGGCTSSIRPEGCDLCTTSAIVHGRITYPDGSSVAGVQLDIQAFADSCTTGFSAQSQGGTDNGWPVTRADGSYEARPISLFGPFTARCFVLTLNPRNDARWLPKTSAQFEGALEFRDDYKGPPRDQLQLDWTLPAPSGQSGS